MTSNANKIAAAILASAKITTRGVLGAEFIEKSYQECLEIVMRNDWVNATNAPEKTREDLTD